MTVDFYRMRNGDCPVIDFLDGLEPKIRTKVLRSVMLLEEFGPELRMPYSKYLCDGIFELRSIAGSDITRVMYFFLEGDRAILTHGFIKKTQKTPNREIEKAKRFREEFCKAKQDREESNE